MTQSIVNTLNNLEQMLVSQKETAKVHSDVVSGMDKVTNFKEVFDNKIVAKKEANKISAISDIKKSKQIKSSDITRGLKDALKQATDEANVETSLDLTLAKDINEIISQLKEAVESTEEAIEGTSEVVLDVNQELVGIVESEVDAGIQNLQNSDISEEKNNSVKGEEGFVFNQLISFVDKSFNTENAEIDSNNAGLNDDNSNTVEFSQAEIIEFSENLSEEILSSKKIENIGTEESTEFVLEEDILRELNIESIKAEMNTAGDEQSLMQNQTPEEHVVKAIINQELEAFEIKLDSAQEIQPSANTKAKTVDVSPSRIIDQVVKHLETLQNNSKVNIVLNPESLGKVNIQLLTTKEGLTAQFTVSTQEARDLIMKGLDSLKEALTSHGVGVDNLSVKVSDAQKSEYNQDWTEQDGSRGGNKGQKNPDREEKQKGLFEKMMAQTQENENGNV